MKLHWQPKRPVSWPSGGSRHPHRRTFLLANYVVCLPASAAEGTEDVTAVTCKRCLRILSVARFDTDDTIREVLARGSR